jgi:hypothetical protein
MKYLSFTIILFLTFLLGCEKQKEGPDEMTLLKEKIDKFVPTDLGYDSSILDEREKVVVEKLYQASKIMDEIFLDQVYSQNYKLRDELKADTSESGKLKLELFTMMFGPFDRLEHDAPFMDTFQPKADEPLAQYSH